MGEGERLAFLCWKIAGETAALWDALQSFPAATHKTPWCNLVLVEVQETPLRPEIMILAWKELHKTGP